MASIRKRTWESGGEIRTAWVVDYFDQAGKRRLKTFQKKKDADAFRIKSGHEVSIGIHTPDSASKTVAEAAELWITRAELNDLEASTLKQYREHVRLHITDSEIGLGGVKLSRLTAPMVQDFADELVKTRSRPLARKVLTSLKSILTEAQRRGLVAFNAAHGCKVAMPTRHKKKLRVGIDIPTKEEANIIFNTAEGRWRPFFITAALTGMRASEMRGLIWDNVDFDNSVIHVTQRADFKRDIGSPKSEAGARDIPMSPLVVNTLKEWKLACPKSGLGLVFPNEKGNVEFTENLHRRGLKPLLIACGISIDTGKVDDDGKPIMKGKYGLHAFRHFYASWLADAGYDPQHVQHFMGHSSIRLTLDTYSHLFPDQKSDADKLAAAERRLIG